MSVGRKPQNIGHFNNKVVARLLLANTLSCIEISKRIGLTHSAASDIVDRLLNMQLIKVSDDIPEKRSRGRQHVRYEINVKRAYFVCISFQHACESVSICDLTGNVIWSEKLSDKTVDKKFFCEVTEKVKAKLSELGISNESVAVVSVAVSGQVDQYSGKMIISFKIGDDFVIKDELAAAFPSAKIDVKNDIVYCCLGSILSEEFDYGNGSSLFLYVGNGIANVFVYNKQIITGANGFSGEIGANYVGDGRRLYDVLSAEDLIKTGKDVLNDPSATLDRVIEKANEYPELRGKFEKVAEEFGIVVRNAIDITGCSHIIISGSINNYPKFFFEKFAQTLKDCVYSGSIEYKIDYSKNRESVFGQIAVSKLSALDWVMEQY